jgi:hypothetical protein
VVTANQLGQVLGFLFRRGVDLELVNAQVRVGAIRERHRSAGPGNLFHGDTVGKVAHAAAAILF